MSPFTRTAARMTIDLTEPTAATCPVCGIDATVYVRSGAGLVCRACK